MTAQVTPVTSAPSASEGFKLSVHSLFKRSCGGIFILSSLVLVLGWVFKIGFFTYLVPGWPTMKPITAIGCMLLSAALYTSISPQKNKLSISLTLVLIFVSSATILDTLFSTRILTNDGLYSLPSDATAICLALSGWAVLSIHFKRYFISGLLAWSCLVLIIFRLMRLLLEGPQASYASIFDSMSIHTALFLGGLVVVGILLHPRLNYHRLILSPDALGVFARWGILLVLFLPTALITTVLRLAERQNANIESLLAISITLMSMFLVVVYYRILNEIKTREEAKHELISQLQTMMDVAPNGILLVDNNGVIQKTNPATNNLFGYNEGELLNSSIDILVPDNYRSVHSDHRNAYMLHPSEKKMAEGRNLVAKRKDGSLFDVEVSLAPMYLKGKQYIFTQVIDVSTRKALELKQQELNEQLSSSNAELQRFAYVASHDLRAPLRRISGFIQLIQSNYEGKLDTQADEWIDRSVENLERMQEMIDGLLRLSRISSEVEIYQPVSLQTIINEALELLSHQINKTKVHINVGLEFPDVMADKAQMLTLFENLISNAIKYGNSDAPEIHIAIHNQTSQKVVVMVRDNGIGISEQHLNDVFDIFKRLHSYQEYEGNGIGLAICKRIVEQHQGKIWCESTIRKGSTFFVELHKVQ